MEHQLTGQHLTSSASDVSSRARYYTRLREIHASHEGAMSSTPAKTTRGSLRRMLTTTVALTLLYIGLQELLVDGLALLSSRGTLATAFQGGIADEAKRVAAASAEREAQLTPEYRVAAYALGVQLGRMSQYLGSFALSEPKVRQQARAASAPRMRAAQELADFLRIGAVYPLESSTAAQFSSLTARIEADEGGIGARIAERTTLKHQHLYMLGMHAGTTLAQLQGKVGAVVPSGEIARHATLAGLTREQWAPLARLPSGGTEAEVAARYEAAVRALQQTIATEPVRQK
jgi:hypothetical protein